MERSELVLREEKQQSRIPSECMTEKMMLFSSQMAETEKQMGCGA